MNSYHVRRCLLCGETAIDVKLEGRLTTVNCSACSATLTIEFDPPDRPDLRARIERIDEPDHERRSFRVRSR
jgi:hypothetical protein